MASVIFRLLCRNAVRGPGVEGAPERPEMRTAEVVACQRAGEVAEEHAEEDARTNVALRTIVPASPARVA